MFDHSQRNIRFGATTLQRLFADPEAVLADAEAFWENEPAMRHAADWHRMVNVPIGWDHFRAGVQTIAAMPSEERPSPPDLQTMREILRRREEFLARGIDHLCSYLPENPATLDIIIYLTGFLRANAFACGQIVVDVTSKYFHDNNLSIAQRASWIHNMLVHECWHGGYCENQKQWTETPLHDSVLYGLLRTLQNEGVATYVNHTAQDLFASSIDPDVRAIDDADCCREAAGTVNQILSQYGTLAKEKLRKLSWERGILGRAYCVGGAHMARTIETSGSR